MTKRIQKYVKFTSKELEQYANHKRSCVKKVNSNLKLNMLPNGLRNFKRSLLDQLAAERLGSYDNQLQGIILDVRNIKVLGNSFPIRFDDPKVHVNLKADCFVFQPEVGSVVRGTVRHVSSTQLGVIIYRVFHVTVRLLKKAKIPIEVDSEINLKVKRFDLENVIPYIEGELVQETKVEFVEPAEVKQEKPGKIRNVDDLDRVLNEIKKEEAMEESAVA